VNDLSLITYLDHINCESCGKRIEVGEYSYIYTNLALCESCMDERLADVKADAQVEVNDSNFDLEKEE